MSISRATALLFCNLFLCAFCVVFMGACHADEPQKNGPSRDAANTGVFSLNTMDADALVRHWQHYFEKILSCEVEYQLVDSDSPEQANAYRFVLNGRKFRADVSIEQGSEKIRTGTIHGKSYAYDGENYQTLVAYTGGQQLLQIRSAPTFSSTPYGQTPPIVAAFRFILEVEAPGSIETFQSDETWAKFRSRIVKIEPFTRKGIPGITVFIKSERPDENYEVFVDLERGFPFYKKVTALIHENGKEIVDVREVEITKTLIWKVGRDEFLWPLDSEGTLTQNGQVVLSRKIQSKGTPRINQLIHTRFTLPRTQATTLVDLTELTDHK